MRIYSLRLHKLHASRLQKKSHDLITFGKRCKDRWNFDETALFAFAPPDRGLASKQMSGKKKSKFRITLGFACNANGSERRPIFYIGKSKHPRCFKKLTPDQ